MVINECLYFGSHFLWDTLYILLKIFIRTINFTKSNQVRCE